VILRFEKQPENPSRQHRQAAQNDSERF